MAEENCGDDFTTISFQEDGGPGTSGRTETITAPGRFRITYSYDFSGVPDQLTITVGGNPEVDTGVASGMGSGEVVFDADGVTPVDVVFTVFGGEIGTTWEYSASIERINAPPHAVDDTVEVEEDGVAIIDVRANDCDPDDDGFFVLDLTSPSNGSVFFDEGGDVIYIPDPDFFGEDSFTYSLMDSNGLVSNFATVTVNVTGVNDGPVAEDDGFTIDEDTVLAGTVAGNDFDIDDDDLLFTLDVEPQRGNLVFNPDGSFTYTPDPDFNGVDAFSYTVSDGEFSSSGAVTITVSAVNDDPVAMDDTAETDESTPIDIEILLNDFDVDEEFFFVSNVVQPDNGDVEVDEGGIARYTPDDGFFGTDTFTYTISDVSGGTSSATVTVTVNRINDDPDAVDDEVETDEDVALVFDPRGNDTDPEDDPLTITSVTQGANGSIAIADDGQLIYTPDANFNGSDSFSYTISDGFGGIDTATVFVNVAPVNDDPVAVDDEAETDEETAVVISVLANDFDVDEEFFFISEATQGQNGTVEIDEALFLVYTPNEDFFGTDSFTYTIQDVSGATATATVTVTVANVNDAPEGVNQIAPQAGTDGQSFGLDVSGAFSDPDGEALAFSATGLPAGLVISAGGVISGTLGRSASQGGPGGDGVYAVTVTATDGAGESAELAFTLDVSNPAPVAVDDTVATGEGSAVSGSVAANDSDPDGDPLSFALVSGPANGTASVSGNGTFTYTPAAGFTGTDILVYSVSDGEGGSDTATLTITVEAGNAPPVAVADSVQTDEDTAIGIDVVANDTDPDGDTLALLSVGAAANGTVTVSGGIAVYTPAAGFFGTDGFTYVVTDPSGATAVGTVTVTVAAVNDAPVAVDDTAQALDGQAVTIDVLANDSDPDGDTLAIASFAQASNGTVAFSEGRLVYTPAEGFGGTDSFTYEVTDGAGGTASATVTVTVTPANRAPVAANDAATTDEDTPVLVAVLANDSDPDGDPLTVTILGATNGSATVQADGTVLFTPAPGFAGDAGFAYAIADGRGGSASATASVTVAPVNDAPVAADDAAASDGSAVVIDLLGNDTDPDGDALAVTAVSDPAGGSVVLNGDGTATYTPDPGFAGTDSFTYEVSDGNGGTATATVTVEVTPGNFPPVAGPLARTTDEDTALTIPLGELGTDPDGDPLTVLEVTAPANGTVEIDGSGNIVYTPAPDFSGTDGFTYTLSDGRGGTVSAPVTVEVAPVNDAPVAETDRTSVRYTASVLFGEVLSNDFDPEDGREIRVLGLAGGGPLGELVPLPEGGTVALNRDGSFVFVLGGAYLGLALGETRVVSFAYDIADPDGAVSTGTVEITVVGPGFDDDFIAPDSGVPPRDDNDGDSVPLPDEPNSVDGGFGDDVIAGGTASDTLNGNDGNDTLTGGLGDDLLIGGNNDDSLDGGEGNDTLFGENGVDFLVGGAGNDTIFGGAGNDKLFGDGGDDVMEGGLGNDALIGGEGADILRGQSGDDILFGNEGDDTVDGGEGADGMLGGTGADVFLFRPGEGTDTVYDFVPGEDLLRFEGFGPGLDAAAVLGGVTVTGAGLLIDTGQGVTVELVGLAEGGLGPDDLVFA